MRLPAFVQGSPPENLRYLPNIDFDDIRVPHPVFKGINGRKMQEDQVSVLQKSDFISDDSLIGIVFGMFIPALVGFSVVLNLFVSLVDEAFLQGILPVGIQRISANQRLQPLSVAFT